MAEMPLYGADQLLDYGPVVFVEGEKARDALVRAGVSTVTNAGGANQRKFGKSLEALRDRDVYLWADNDPQGVALMSHLAVLLAPLAKSLHRVTWPEAPLKGDAANAISAGVDVYELIAAAEPIEAAITAARARDGASWIFSENTPSIAIWGDDERVAWSQGETLMIVGPQGVGKTTIEDQLIRACCGLQDKFLGLSVKARKRIFLAAGDRPQQHVRSFRRMVSDADADVLRDRLIVWPGPLPFDIGTEPERLVQLCQEHGADTLFIDGLKDVAMDLSKDAVGARVNHALQLCLTSGIEVCVIYWPRKAQADNKRPRSLADVYGSTWITAGVGSVLLLWGEPGDSVVELEHLKQPLEPVGPMQLLHNHTLGETSVMEGFDLLALVRTPGGMTVQEAARRMFVKADPSRNEVEKARRALDTLVRKELAVLIPGTKGGGKDREIARYFGRESNHGALKSNHGSDTSEQSRGLFEESNHPAPEPLTGDQRSNSKGNHDFNHGNHGPAIMDPGGSLEPRSVAAEAPHCWRCGSEASAFDASGKPVCEQHHELRR